MCLCQQAVSFDTGYWAVMLGGWGGTARLAQWQITAGFMSSVTCGLIAAERDQLRNPTLVSSITFSSKR